MSYLANIFMIGYLITKTFDQYKSIEQSNNRINEIGVQLASRSIEQSKGERLRIIQEKGKL